MTNTFEPIAGGCTCGQVRYRMNAAPLIVHGCHCTWCQRQTGSAFAVNALVEADNVEILQGEVEALKVPSPSGKGQIIARCPTCRVAVWSNYYMGGLMERIRFIRVGSLDHPDRLPPDVHIFTSTKVPWVQVPEDHMRVDIFYDAVTTWSPDSLRRLDALEAAAGIETSWRHLRRED